MSFGFSAHGMFLFPSMSRSITLRVIPLLKDTISKAIGRIYETFTESLPYTSNFLFCSVAKDYIPRYALPFTYIVDAAVRRDKSPMTLLVCSVQVVAFAKMASADGVPLPTPCYVAVNALWFLACAYKGYQTVCIATQRFSHACRREMPMAKKVLCCADSVMLLSAGTYTVTLTAFQVMQFVEGFQVFLSMDEGQQEYALRYDTVPFLRGSKTCLAVHMDSFHSDKIPGHGARPLYIDDLYKNCHVRGYNINHVDDFCGALADAADFSPYRITFLSLVAHASPTGMRLGSKYRFTGNFQEIACMNTYLVKDAQVILAGCNTAEPIVSRNPFEHLTDSVSQSLPERFVTGFSSSFYGQFAHAVFRENRLFIQAHTWSSSDNICVNYQGGRIQGPFV